MPIPEKAIQLLRSRDSSVKFVQVQFTDAANLIRYRIYPISYFSSRFTWVSPRPAGVPFARGTFGMAYLRFAEGFGAQGEYMLMPDWSTVRVLEYQPGYVSIMGWIHEKKALEDEQSFDFCPRGTLRRIVQQAKEMGISFLVGFETEFVLLSSTDPVTPIHMLEAYTAEIALPTGSKAQIILEEIVECLEKSDVGVQMFHPEAAPGQYELVTLPLDPIQAVDALVHTRQTIYGVASKHGVKATLAPQVVNWSAGSATHVHISIKRTVSAPGDSEALTDDESSFLAGLTSSFRAILPFTLTTPSSYTRVGDGIWTGGTWVSWGTDNRECPIRLCATLDTSGSNQKHFEWKMLDGTANPYFALAAILGVGLEGIKQKEKLTVKDCSESSASELTADKRAELGIMKQLPTSLAEARAILMSDEGKTVRKVLGESTVTKFLRVNETMEQALSAPETDEKKLKLLVETY